MAKFLEEQTQTASYSLAGDKNVSASSQNNSDKLKQNHLISSELVPKTKIGKCYEIVEPLTDLLHGSCDSKAYIVRDCESRQSSPLVLELIYNPQTASKQLSQEDFLERFKLVQKMSTHGQIPKLYNSVVEEEGYYIVYEYIGGEILDATMKSRQLNEIEIVNLLQDMARIYDFLFRNRLINCTFSPQSIRKSQYSHRYVLGNFQELFFNPPLSRDLTAKEQRSLFRRQLKLLANLIVQSLTVSSYEEIDLSKAPPLSWCQKTKLSPRLQNILEKMLSPHSESSYESIQQLSEDFKPLLNIDRVLRGKYRLIRYLGAKNGVKTYLARSNTEGSSALLIVKQLEIDSHHFAGGKTIVTAKISELEKEVEKLQQLTSVGKIELVREEEQEELYLVRLYTEGISLSKKLNRQKHFSPRDVRELLKKALLALEKIHALGLTHRNIKPSNIIISGEQNEISLVDFGVLQGLDDGKEVSARIRQPPEQLVGRPTVGSDIYALGIVAIEALTGLSIRELPQNSDWGRSIWQEKLASEPDLIKIIEKAIDKDVDKRYASVSEVLQQLEGKTTENKKHFSKSLQILKKLRITSSQKKLIGSTVAAMACVVGGIELISPVLRPQYLTWQGKQQLQTNPQEALVSFNKAIALAPRKVAAWQGKGDASSNLGESDSALTAYGKVLSLNFDREETWHKQGDVYAQLKDWQQALKSYSRTLDLNPENSLVAAKKSQIFYHLARYPEAFELQEKALDTSVADAELMRDSAQTALALGKYNQALTLFNRTQNIAPSRPDYWQDKAIALSKLQRKQEALKTIQLVMGAYSEALEQDSQNIDLWLGKGAFMQQIQRYPEALAAYREATAIAENEANPWLGKSKLMLELKEYQEAAIAVDRAIELEPDSFSAWHLKGDILQQMQDSAGAIAAYNKAIAFNKSYFPAYRDRSEILLKQNDTEKAIQSLEKSVSLAPQDVESWLNLARALQTNQKIEEAAKAIDRAIALQPRNSTYWLEKGSLWELKQQYTKACNIYRQAMKIAPDLKISGAMNRVGCDLE